MAGDGLDVRMKKTVVLKIRLKLFYLPNKLIFF